MSQTQQTASAQQAQNLNQTLIITYFKCDNGTICIVSIVSPDGKTRFFGNGIGTIVPMNRITKKCDTPTPVEKQKQYIIHFENGKLNVFLDGKQINTFDENFGLPDGISRLENVSFQQFVYDQTAVDERTEPFREILGQLVSAYRGERFCLEDPAKQKTAHVEGMKVRIPQPIFDLVKHILVFFGVSTCSFVEHLMNGSTIGVSRGDIDCYVLDEKQAKLTIKILTQLGFVKNSKDKSNDNTFRIYLDVLCQKFSHEAIMPNFNLPEGSVPAQYYIEVEIKIATEFQKEYESNCLGYFLGLLLSRYFKISNSGISLKHDCDEIPINVDSIDEFLKELGINLDGIQTTQAFIDQLLVSPLISEIMTVDDILRLFKNIMGDEKTKHTSKPLREWLHLLVCGLKERFPDRFSSLRSEIVQEMVRDEKSGQMIPIWSVRLFVLNIDSVFYQVQMEKGILSIDCGKKHFVSTGVDGNSLIFSEKQLKSDSGKKALPERLKSCSVLFELLKEYFDYLKEINTQRPFIERFIDALRCRSEVCSHLGQLGCELMKKIRDELMNPLYPVSRKKKTSMDGKAYGDLMKQFQPAVIIFSKFQLFCVENHGLDGDYHRFIVRMMPIFAEYHSQIGSLSPDLSSEEHKQMRGEIYAAAMLNIDKLCLDLVEKWTRFHNSDVNWRDEGIREFHIPSQTYHETNRSDWRPYYLGTSVLGGINVHVFMDGESGEVFTMEIE